MSNRRELERISPSLQIKEYVEVQKRGFVVQKYGLIFIVGAVLLAALGVFGDGPLSKKRHAADRVSIEFERFHRFEARMRVKIKASSSEGEMRVSFPNTYLKSFKIEGIVPEPNAWQNSEHSIDYVFNGSGPFEITYHLVPQTFGTVKGAVKIESQSLSIHHFIYP